jgi:hypothetical protein
LTYNFWSSAITAGFGALLGSISAFAFQRWWSYKQERKTQLAAGHRAIFAVICAIDAIKDYHSRAVAPRKENPAGWLLPPSTFVPPSESFIEGLEFLLPGEGKLLYELALETRRYEAARTAIETYAQFSFSELQPAIEKTGLVAANLIEIENRLGPRISGTAQSNWREVCYHVSETCNSLPEALEKLQNALAREFPNQTFMTIEKKNDT